MLSPRMTDVIVRNDKAFTDSESTFVASVCECGAAVRDDGLVLGMKGFVGDDGGWFLHGPSRASGTGMTAGLLH